MKRISFYLFVTMAMLMLTVSSAWAQYVKLTANNGKVSWIEIEGYFNDTNNEASISGIDKNTKGSIDLNEVWSISGGSGTNYHVTKIGDDAFYRCSGLTSVVIPSSVTKIGDSAFESCSGLTSIEIPSSVTSIGNYAFSNCSGLTSIVVESGNSVYDSRNNCNAIIETTSNTLIAGCNTTMIPSSVTSIGWYAFYGCSGLTSVDIPSCLTSIGQYSFYGCSGLTSIDIPSCLTSIGSQAFYGCSGLTSIDLPSSVESIGTQAFFNCLGLTSITSYITDVFNTGWNAFYGCDNVTLYVPKGLVSTYQSTPDWNSIKKIKEIPGIALAMSCNNKGKVKINGTTDFTNNVGEVSVYDSTDNTFVFTPEENCQLEQVLIDGLDVTLSVKNNQLTTKVHEGSKMIVMFSKSSGDMNGDGQVNINDVVKLVNAILGQ